MRIIKQNSAICSSKSHLAINTIHGINPCRAKETPRVKPVPEESVYAVLPFMTPVVAAMVELQLLTGMRPGEVTIIRPCDLEMDGDMWHYYPEKHKNLYRDYDRIISIGPREQNILRPFLLRNRKCYCFSPKESESYRRKKMFEDRKTPLHYGNRPGTNQIADAKRKPGDCYDSAAYRRAVERAINKAIKTYKAEGKDIGLLVKWTPYQLRHTAATKARKMFNYETAGALLGHSNMSATAVYAERNQGLADEVAKKLG